MHPAQAKAAALVKKRSKREGEWGWRTRHPLTSCVMLASSTFPALGFGLGLRARHVPSILEQTPAVDWFEIISENYMDTGGKPRQNLARIAAHYPVVMHGVSLSIGTCDPLNSQYLKQLKALMREVNPAWVSDHLCWTGVAHKNTHDLLPVPYTEAALTHIVQRIRAVQDYLERPIALENPSTYLEFSSSSMPEAEFIARMAEEAQCQLLLDVNNVYVSCFNHGWDAKQYLDTLPMDRVIQIHLAGHTHKGTHIIDTHDDHVTDAVWQLYQYVVQRAGRVPNTMIEWDDKLPEFPVLLEELNKARQIAASAATVSLPERAPAVSVFTPRPTLPLEQQQQCVQDAVMQPAAPSAAALDWIREKPHFPAAKQLQVYRNAYRWRLHDVVTTDYPVLQHYLGEKQFSALLHGFIDQVAPNHFNVARYAAGLPAYARTYAGVDAVAQEICTLETAIAQLADGTESTALTPQHLAAIAPEQLMQQQLLPRYALQLFAFEYAIDDYYRAVKEGVADTQPIAIPSWLAVFRHEDVVWRMALSTSEYTLLSQLFAGVRVGDVLDDPQHALQEEDVTHYFSRWMRNGLLRADESLVSNP